MMHGIHPEAKLYSHVNISNSILKEFVSIGDFSKIQNSTIEENARIDRHNHIDASNIGRYSYTGRNTMILHAKIGSFCSISWNVSIGGANHDYTRMTQHSFLYNEYDKIRPEGVDAPYDRFLAPVTVGNDVWIAAGVVVARGVTIGDGAVIGANAVVTRDVPPYAIVAGAPAKIIKYRFEPDMVDFLLELKWWFWPVEEIKKQFSLLSDKPSLDNLKESFTV